MGGKKLKSNFKSIKIEILPQYKNNIFTLGILPKKNSYPTVTIALWYIIFNQEAPVAVHLPYLCQPSFQQLEIQGSIQRLQEPQTYVGRIPLQLADKKHPSMMLLAKNYRFTRQKGIGILFS